ncbi:MAG: YqhA family protein [Chitinophagales bacterium]
MFKNLVSNSRYLILFAVIGSLISATSLLLHGSWKVLKYVSELVQHGVIDGKGDKGVILSFIEVIDEYLLATVIYIISAGLYELFIDPNVKLPQWLEINNLDDLKHKLIDVVIVVMAVLFLGQLVSWNGERDLLGYGVATGLVITALTFFRIYKVKEEKSKPKA